MKQIVLTVAFLTSMLSSYAQEETISFPNYGPVAFDAFWRLPDDPVSDHINLQLSSRGYNDWRGSNFFTQYFRLDIPIGSGHSFILRAPWQYYQVDPTVANELDMLNAQGSEFGDVDVIFSIRFLRKKLDKIFNEKLALQLTGEMHTAPTGRENKQFTDALKMLGTLNVSYLFLNQPKHALRSDVLIGMGGWDDLVQPLQKHALKVSSKVDYSYRFENDKYIKFQAGGTYIYAQGIDNRGLLLKGGVHFGKEQGFQIGVSYGRMNYHTAPKTNSYVNRMELAATFPLKK